MRITVCAPISPDHVGTGIANRVRNWVQMCGRFATVNTIIIPVVGPALPGDTVITPGPDTDDRLPRLARGLTAQWGRNHAHVVAGSDLVVVVRSYLAEFATGLVEESQVPLLLDLDDDDASYFAQVSDHKESARYAALVQRVQGKCAAIVSADGFGQSLRIPNSVPFPSRRRAYFSPGQHAVIVGNFGYTPNADGARWFLQEVFPLVTHRLPEFTVSLVGPGSPDMHSSGIGVVDDLSAEYSRAAVAVAPILTGSGTRTKIIEAWAHECPVVSTSLGASGLGARPGRHFVVGDTASEMADAIIDVISDGELARSLSEGGREFAEKEYHPDHVARLVQDVCMSIAQAGQWVVQPGGNLEISETDEGLVIFDSEADIVHNLNMTAGAVFMMADGTTGVDAIARELMDAFGLDAPPIDVVEEAVKHLVQARLVTLRRVN